MRKFNIFKGFFNSKFISAQRNHPHSIDHGFFQLNNHVVVPILDSRRSLFLSSFSSTVKEFEKPQPDHHLVPVSEIQLTHYNHH